MLLQTCRQEMKYVIPVAEFYKIRPLLAACLALDTSGGPEGYTVRTLYFDDAYETDVQDVLDGMLNKQKVRLRLYPPDTSMIKLEYKCKTDTNVMKHAIVLSKPEAEAMIAGDCDFLLQREEPFAKEVFARIKLGAYLPRVIVSYRRLAYVQPMSDIRVTFDEQITAGFSPRAFFDIDPADWPVLTPDYGVLEVKYSAYMPGYLQKILMQIDDIPGANSKYINARLLL
jgi:hypothetical protein